MASHDPATALAQAARDAFTASQLLDAHERHVALIAVKDALTTAKQEILDANRKDIEASRERYSGSARGKHTDPRPDDRRLRASRSPPDPCPRPS